jgi:hypothetical protein
MRWGYVRIAIFTAAFLVGTLLNWPDRQTAKSAATTVQNLAGQAGTIEIQCTESNFTLVHASSGSEAKRVHFRGM